jgi:hypothetical protein
MTQRKFNFKIKYKILIESNVFKRMNIIFKLTWNSYLLSCIIKFWFYFAKQAWSNESIKIIEESWQNLKKKRIS